MESSRSKILDILRQRHEATVEDLTQALDLAPATVRRHLDILQRDGYITVRPVRRETGRPHYAFSMTSAGEELFPHNYVRITNRLIDEIAALAPEDTAGKSGRELADVIFQRMTERLAHVYGPRVTGATIGERISQVSKFLAAEGISLDVQAEGSGFVLLGQGCPCRRLAQGQVAPCTHDQRLLASLLGAEVERTALEGAEDDAVYVYRVRV